MGEALHGRRRHHGPGHGTRREPRRQKGVRDRREHRGGKRLGLRPGGVRGIDGIEAVVEAVRRPGPSVGQRKCHRRERLPSVPRLSRRRRTSSNPTARPLRSYRFPLLPPLLNAARSPSLPPGSLFSFDRRWSNFLRPLSCFCFATRTPTSGGQNPSTLGSWGPRGSVAGSARASGGPEAGAPSIVHSEGPACRRSQRSLLD